MPNNNYTNAQDLQNTKDYGFGAQVGAAQKLAQMLTQQSQFASQQEQQKAMPGIEQEAQGKQAQLKAMLGQQEIDQNLKTAQDFVTQNAKMGRKLNVKAGPVDVSQGDTNYFLQNSKMADSEGKILADRATKAYEPINKQAQAVKATIDSLNLGNPTGDNAAVMNEVQAIGNNPRGLVQLMTVMGKKPTANTKAGEMMDYINNTARQGLSDSQRDNMREFAFSRLPQLKQQHSSISSALIQTAPSYAHSLASQGQIEPLVNNYGSSAAKALDDLDQYSQQYKQLKGSSQVSQPSQFDKPVSNIDKLKAFFGGFKPQQQAAPAPQTNQATVPQQQSVSDPGMQRYQELLKKQQKGQ